KSAPETDNTTARTGGDELSDCQTETNIPAMGARERAQAINQGLAGTRLHSGMVETTGEQNTPFRISPEPFWIDRKLFQEIESLGPHLLAFYQAANRLYLQSVRGSQPGWVR